MIGDEVFTVFFILNVRQTLFLYFSVSRFHGYLGEVFYKWDCR